MGLVLQRLSDWLYPPACALCATPSLDPGALCASCWRETPFLNGLGCDLCGASLLGDAQDGVAICDDCQSLPRPWAKGRAALSYAGGARRMVLALKHGDRIDLARPAARWMTRAGRDVLPEDSLLVPVPISRLRLLRRRHNQAADLAAAIAGLTGLQTSPQALIRARETPSQDHRTVLDRYANLDNAIRPHPRYGAALKDRTVTIIDDVMTSGATLSAAATAAHDAGAMRVFVLVLARVEKTP